MDISKAKMQGHQRDRKRRVGRGAGSGAGKTCGRGMDGAKSRSGWTSRGVKGGGVPAWRRLPKTGFKNEPFRTTYSTVNVSALERFDAGTVVTKDMMIELGLLTTKPGSQVKVLGGGELTKALTVEADAFSKSAVRKIEEAGGTVKVIPGPKPPERNKMRTEDITVVIE